MDRQDGIEIFGLLTSARAGDARAVNRLFELMYGDLRRIARARLRRNAHDTLLDTTALVHESYERFARLAKVDVTDRSHFLAYAARVMRSVIVDLARERKSQRRGGHLDRVLLDTGLGEALAEPQNDVLQVHEALEVLTKADARLAQIVEMRYFGGLTEAEIAETLQLSERTVRRDWEKARLLLSVALK